MMHEVGASFATQFAPGWGVTGYDAPAPLIAKRDHPGRVIAALAGGGRETSSP